MCSIFLVLYLIYLVTNICEFYLGWSEFGPWSKCDCKCGGGKRRRERVCLARNIWQCGGLAEEDEDCNLEPCPGINHFS